MQLTLVNFMGRKQELDDAEFQHFRDAIKAIVATQLNYCTQSHLIKTGVLWADKHFSKVSWNKQCLKTERLLLAMF